MLRKFCGYAMIFTALVLVFSLPMYSGYHQLGDFWFVLKVVAGIFGFAFLVVTLIYQGVNFTIRS